MATITPKVSYNGTSQIVVTTPPNIPVVSPGLQYWIINNGGGGQYAGLNLPPVSFSSSDYGQLVDVAFIDSADASTKLSTIAPSITSKADGQIYVQGTSSALAQAITVKMQAMGRQNDRTGYLVIDVTNTGGGTLTLKSVVLSLLNTHFCASRGYGISASTGDAYAYDSTNKIIRLSNSGVTNIISGFTSNFAQFASATQHHQIVDTTINEVTQVTGSGALADSISGTATSTKGVYLAIGDNTNRLTITSGSTARYVFVLGASNSQANLTTLLTTAQTNFATDITTFSGFATTTHMTQKSPSAYVDTALDYLLMHEFYKGKFQKSSNGYEFNPAGSYTYFSCFARDGYYGKMAMSQCGATANVKDEYLLQKSGQFGDFTQCHEIIDSFQDTGFRQDASNNGVPGDEEPYVIMKAYEYYIRTLDATFLGAEINNLNSIANYMKTWYDTNTNGKSSDNLMTSDCNATYLDSGGCQMTNYVVDPIFVSTVIYALRAIVEMNTAAGNTSLAATYSTWRDTMIAGMPNLWESSKNWLTFNKNKIGTVTVANPHLMKVDALIFDALQDTDKQAAMITKLATDSGQFWNDAQDVTGFQMFPTADGLFSGLGIGWYGPPWNIGDCKAFEAIFRYGTATQAQWGWRKLTKYVRRICNVNYYSPAEYYGNIGQFEFSSGSFVEMIIKGLWGIDAHAQYFTCVPNIAKLSLGGDWKINNLTMGGSTWTVTHTGVGRNVTMTLDGSPVSGNISYPAAGSHTLAIAAGGRSVS